ncbi:RecJ-like exonuclease [Prauserella isguenensis]|uniref:RecJ-like exonuclease n=1 Tax=Prauserella isguenensis TaxID=1470180 RepID=A0A839RWX1_9PSEU|nr:RecJ-like exonuclease [Prauserella isguenensis]
MQVGDMVDCPRCHGSGLTPNRKGPCPNCGGLGQVPQRQGRGETPRWDGPPTEAARVAGCRGRAVSSQRRAVINNSVTPAQ